MKQSRIDRVANRAMQSTRRFALLAAFSFAALPAAANAQVAGTATLGVTSTTYQAVAYGARASKIVGAYVYNDRNQRIAQIDDLVVAPDRKVSFVVMHVGEFLNMGAKQVAVPAARFTSLTGKIVLPNATKSVLEALPAFKFSK